MTTRAWFRVHSFTGVITGLLLFVICWSGTFAVIANELDWLVTPEVRVETGGEPQSWGTIASAVRSTYPDAEINLLQAPLYAGSAAQVRVDFPNQKLVWVYVDPYTADVIGSRSFFNTQRFFRSLHYTLLVSLTAGLIFYKRWWRGFLRWPGGRGRALWSGIHKFAGLWSIWFIVVMVLTGLWYLVELSRSDFGDGKVSFAGSSPSSLHIIPQPTSDPALPHLPIDLLIERADTLRPDLRARQIYLNDQTAVLWGQSGYLLVRDRANQLHLDRRTGEVLYNQTPHDYDLYWRWADTADPLHFGDFGGLWSKGIWFAFGLVLSGLILTGTWLHAHRLAREAGGRARHRWPGTAAALAVTLLVLAASVPYGVAEARGYGPMVEEIQRFPELAPGVAMVIAGWIVLTLAIIAAWIVLLWRPQTVLQETPAAKNAGSRRVKGNRRISCE